jgi:hypothetical protein
MSQTPPPLPGDLPPAPPPLPGSTPPTVPGALGASSGGWVTPYSFSNAFSKGLELFRTIWGPLVLMTLVVIGVSILSFLLQQGAILAFQSWVGMVMSYVLNFAFSVLVMLPLIAGCMIIVAERIRGRTNVGVGDIFGLTFGARYAGVMIAGLLFTLAMYLAGLIIVSPLIATGLIGGATLTPGPGGVTQVQGVTFGLAIGLGLLFCLVGGIAIYYFMARFSVAVPLALDTRVASMGTIDCFRASWHLTKGKGWSILGLGLVTGILSALTVLLLCIGIVLVGYPLLLATFGAAYAMIVQPLVKRDVCTSCGFDLAGNTSGTCPECGTFNAQATGAQGLSRTA